MKKFIYTFYLLCNLACICSCVNEEADLFDSSAAQRLNQAVTEYTDLLENSENGWILDYYPSELTVPWVAIPLTVVFKNGKSAIASEDILCQRRLEKVDQAGTGGHLTLSSKSRAGSNAYFRFLQPTSALLVGAD